MANQRNRPLDVRKVTSIDESRQVSHFTLLELYGKKPTEGEIASHERAMGSLREATVAAFAPDGAVIAAAGLMRVNAGDSNGLLYEVVTAPHELGSTEATRSVIYEAERQAVAVGIASLGVAQDVVGQEPFFTSLGYEQHASEDMFTKQLIA